MKIVIKLMCRKCNKRLTKGGSCNDPDSVNYYCKKCGYVIVQLLKVDTGLQPWQRKK